MEHPSVDNPIDFLVSQSKDLNGLFSTGAEVVYFSGDLYNISGSTHDPPEVEDHENLSWKRLLIRMAGLTEDTSCYVTNVAAPSGSSHPQFSVGGHMTTNPDGIVERGEDCYLMPLCSWHNSTRRNGMRFEHSATKMLRLSGFMLGDSPITFSLRQRSKEQFALLFYDTQDKRWRIKNIDTDAPSEVEQASIGNSDRPSPALLLLERSSELLHVKRVAT